MRCLVLNICVDWIWWSVWGVVGFRVGVWFTFYRYNHPCGICVVLLFTNRCVSLVFGTPFSTVWNSYEQFNGTCASGAQWPFNARLKRLRVPEKGDNNIIFHNPHRHSSSHICPVHQLWNSRRRLGNIKRYFISLIVMDLMLHTFAWKTNLQIYLKFNYKVLSEHTAVVDFSTDYDLNLLLTWCLRTWMIY